MKLTKKMTIIGLMLIGLNLATFGCNDGPAEEAGEEIDQAIEKAGDKVEDATDQMKE